MADFPNIVAACEAEAQVVYGSKFIDLDPGLHALIVRSVESILEGLLKGTELYEKAVTCGMNFSHNVDQIGKPCTRCGAERVWVNQVEKE